MSVEFDFNVSLNKFAPVSPMLLSVDLRMEKSGLLMDAICVLFLLSSPPKSSFSSVLFDFNASLNDVAPVSPMLLSVGFYEKGKEWIVYECHLCAGPLSSRSRLSTLSVVFDCNASLNDVAPLSVMLFPVDFMKMEKSVLLMDAICAVSFVFTTQIDFCDCCV